MTLDESQTMSPTEWGWEIKDGLVFPIYTNAAAAPDELLNVIDCNCKTDCATVRCSCRRHGLVCTLGCGECRGESCMNSINKMLEAELEDGDLTV